MRAYLTIFQSHDDGLNGVLKAHSNHYSNTVQPAVTPPLITERQAKKISLRLLKFYPLQDWSWVWRSRFWLSTNGTIRAGLIDWLQYNDGSKHSGGRNPNSQEGTNDHPLVQISESLPVDYGPLMWACLFAPLLYSPFQGTSVLKIPSCWSPQRYISIHV